MTPHRSAGRRAGILLLCAALLCARWAGWAHAIGHDESVRHAAALVQGQGHGEHDPAHTYTHSCAAFDAATLGVVMPGPSLTQDARSPAPECIVADPLAPHVPSLIRSFDSRAPPLLMVS